MQHWVLIKGMKQDQRHWIDLPERMRTRFGGEVVCLDLPGVGTQAHREAPSSVPAMARDLRARFAEVRANAESGAWSVLGLSLGGMVAMQWAKAFPEDWSRVVIGNSSAANVAPAHWRLRPANWGTMARAAIMRDPYRRERAVLDLISATTDAATRDAVAARHVKLQQAIPFRRSTWVRQMRAAGGFRAPDGLDVPALVLIGRGDRFVDPRCGDRLAARLGADVAEHAEAGHDLGLDAPAWVVDAVADWLAKDA